ncbi:MAG: hypothetical protein ABH848_03720 [Candidatus Omnitrophota bacterium]
MWGLTPFYFDRQYVGEAGSFVSQNKEVFSGLLSQKDEREAASSEVCHAGADKRCFFTLARISKDNQWMEYY